MLVRYDPDTGDIVGRITGNYDTENELVPVIEVEEQDLDGKKVEPDTLELVSA